MPYLAVLNSPPKIPGSRFRRRWHPNFNRFLYQRYISGKIFVKIRSV